MGISEGTIMIKKSILLAVLAFWNAAVGAQTNCDMGGDFGFICDFVAPEDIELAGDERTLLIGEMVLGGRLIAVDSETYDGTELFPAKTRVGTNDWGESSCDESPQEMTFHGIDLRQKADQTWQLLVVNHGLRESVEFFELFVDADSMPLGLVWRGCVLSPNGELMNDVAGLPGGGFLSTTPFVGNETWSNIKALLGFNIGHVREWSPTKGWSIIEGTQSRYPNGVIATPDGNQFYVNLYVDGLVRAFRRDGEILQQATVVNGDNLSWGQDGKIRIVSHRTGLTQMMAALRTQPHENSSVPFAVIEYSPSDGSVRDIFEHDGSLFGAATVAQEVNGQLFLGAFRGERVGVIDLPQ